jgi:hypothetical protein
MGCEMDWLTEDGEWQPPSDQRMSLFRAMAWQKPYCILMNTPFPRFTPDLVEKYMQRCLFYGIWPSMFSHNASEDPYWRNPDYYNRDRHLFRRYIPLVRRVAEAGWEPVTHATSSDADVWVERFGPGRDGAVYLTVFNSASGARTAVVRGDAAQLRCSDGGQVIDIVAGSAGPADWHGGTLSFEVIVGPEQVRVLQMHPPADE